MRRLALTRVICLVLAAATLIAAYLGRGDWFILPALAALAALWYFLRNYPVLWRSSGLLICYLGLAAASLIAGSTPILLIFGVAAALAAWDLLNFAETLSIAASPEYARRMRRAHGRSLGLAVILGLVSALLASNVQFEFPFAVIAALAIVLIASLAGVLQRVRVASR